MTLADYLSETFVRNALIAATLVAVTAGLIGPVVIVRDLAFAVHGTAELAFTGAAAGLLVAGDPLLGALLGSHRGGHRDRLSWETVNGERNSAIGVILAFGLGVGVYLLSLYKGFATAATNILFGQIFGVSPGQITLLTAIAIGVLIAMVVLYRPLLFASVDPELAEARGVRTRLVGLLFVYVLALTVTEAAQIVGTLLVLSLAITPAAAPAGSAPAHPVVIVISIAFALIAADGGLVLSLIHPDVKASVFISRHQLRVLRPRPVAARFVTAPRCGARRQSVDVCTRCRASDCRHQCHVTVEYLVQGTISMIMYGLLAQGRCHGGHRCRRGCRLRRSPEGWPRRRPFTTSR